MVEFRMASRPDSAPLSPGIGRLVVRTERISGAGVDSVQVQGAGFVRQGSRVLLDSLKVGLVQFGVVPARQIPLQVGVTIREGHTDTVVVRPTSPDAVVPCNLR
jgi:hypothetical protein